MSEQDNIRDNIQDNIQDQAEEKRAEAEEITEPMLPEAEEAVQAEAAAEAVPAEAAAEAEKWSGTGRNKKEKVKRSVGHEIFSWVMTLLIAVVAALLIRSFIFEPVRVDGESMLGTLKDKEIVFVSKFDYSSTWLSFPWMNDEAKENAARIVPWGEPQRFDVVICRYPGRGDTNFVKRVVGLPGDTVELREGYLYINGELMEEPWIEDQYRTGRLNTFGPYTVPEGHYFVMGDHRNNSNDSRSQGALERSSIIGHVRCVLFPFSSWRGVQ